MQEFRYRLHIAGLISFAYTKYSFNAFVGVVNMHALDLYGLGL